MNNTATNTATCPTVRKQIGKTTYIVRVHFSETAKGDDGGQNQAYSERIALLLFIKKIFNFLMEVIISDTDAHF